MADTRAVILAEARDLFVQAGLSGFSMRRVSERCDLTVSALYRHFDSKDALLAQMLETSFATFAGYLMRALDASTPLERFRATARQYFEFGLAHPRDYTLMFLTDCAELGYEKLQEETRERLGSSFRFLVNRIDDCMEAGAFKATDAEQTALVVWAHTHGLISLYLLGQLKEITHDEFRAVARVSLESLIGGLGAPPAGSIDVNTVHE